MYLMENILTSSELNNLSYKEAIENDKRSYCTYYKSLIITKHLLFFSFLPTLDYNSRIIKIFLFFFDFSANFTVNAIFFNDDTMHKIYIDGGKFDFIYNIPQILYSSLISGFINVLINKLALSDSNFYKLRKLKGKNNFNAKAKETLRLLKLKFVIFFVISLLFLIAFWFYIACFCAVYENTQIHLIKDTVISFGTSMLYPLGIYLLPGIFRIISLKGKNKECLYKFRQILQIF